MRGYSLSTSAVNIVELLGDEGVGRICHPCLTGLMRGGPSVGARQIQEDRCRKGGGTSPGAAGEFASLPFYDGKLS